MAQPRGSQLTQLMQFTIGLMSGTSLDGVDGVVLQLPKAQAAQAVHTGPVPQHAAQVAAPPLRVLGHAHRPFPAALRTELAALNQAGADEIHRTHLAAVQLSTLYAEVVADLLRATGLQAAQIAAIGAHGQTVRHRPDCGYTVQINAPALLAERCGIAVVADFRSRDMAAGGQGAPLVPAFHRAVFWQPEEALAVLNLGGIANLTLIDTEGHTTGFDSGPANALLDAWALRHLGQDYDANGTWAASGAVLPGLLQALLADAHFQAAPPKSTGRDHFQLQWLELAMHAAPMAEHAAAPQDVQATLAELTAQSAAQALHRHLPAAKTLLVCGGGAFNADLMRRLRAQLPGVDVLASSTRGLPPQQVEAAAFAWLAAQTLAGLPGNVPEVTGARGLRVLGAIYPA
ncbi:MAG: anhydro-N-acetylmuramic acid kinase [Thiomonas sp.]